MACCTVAWLIAPAMAPSIALPPRCKTLAIASVTIGCWDATTPFEPETGAFGPICPPTVRIDELTATPERTKSGVLYTDPGVTRPLRQRSPPPRPDPCS